MKKIISNFILLSSFVILFSACKKEQPTQYIKFNNGIGVLSPGQTGLFFIHGESRPMQIRLIEVTEDSRCPIEARCIWIGEVVAKIKVDKSKEFLVASTETTQKPVFYNGKHITITHVEPQPRIGKKISQDEYKLEFKISD